MTIDVDPNESDDNKAEYVSVESMRIDVDPNESDDNKAEYVSVESMRIDVVSTAGGFFDYFDVDDKKAVIKQIATYAITLVTGLMGIKAERDDNNLLLDRDGTPSCYGVQDS